MTWITLHREGKRLWINPVEKLTLSENDDGSACILHHCLGVFDETPEQVLALIEEAEREAEYRRAAIRKELGL